MDMNWPVIEWSACTDCSLCVDICSLLVFQLQGDDVVISGSEDCDDCGECEEICPVAAIKITSESEEKQWRRPSPNSTKR